MIIDVLAWTGAALACALCLPQASRSLRSRQPHGGAASTYSIVLANSAVWAAWACLTGELAAAVPSAINGPAAAFILLRSLRRRGSAPRQQPPLPCRHRGAPPSNRSAEGAAGLTTRDGRTKQPVSS